jgi:hypothetical protein
MEYLDFQVLSQMTDTQLTNLFGVRDFFVYELDFATINAGLTGSATFTVQTDSNFLWQQGTYDASIAGAAYTQNTRPIPNMNCTIQDTSSGRQLMSSPVPIPSMFGTGQLPFVIPAPRFFRANTQVTVSVTNFDAAVNYDLKLSFIGTKFYKFSGTQ